MRIAFQVEVVQNDLRKKITNMIKVSANRDFETAILLIDEYMEQVKQERSNAEEAIEIIYDFTSFHSNAYMEGKNQWLIFGVSWKLVIDNGIYLKYRDGGWRRCDSLHRNSSQILSMGMNCPRVLLFEIDGI